MGEFCPHQGPHNVDSAMERIRTGTLAYAESKKSENKR